VTSAYHKKFNRTNTDVEEAVSWSVTSYTFIVVSFAQSLSY
jgi:hypothetical protein